MSKMIIPKKGRSRIHVVYEATIIALIFLIAFAAGLALMKLVYGAELPPEYQQTIDATVNATGQTDGLMIDQYVANIKSEICPTLTNQIDVKDCFAI